MSKTIYKHPITLESPISELLVIALKEYFSDLTIIYREDTKELIFTNPYGENVFKYGEKNSIGWYINGLHLGIKKGYNFCLNEKHKS